MSQNTFSLFHHYTPGFTLFFVIITDNTSKYDVYMLYVTVNSTQTVPYFVISLLKVLWVKQEKIDE